MIDENDAVFEPKASGKNMESQEAKIYRVPPWQWREIKKDRAIDPNLPTLIASSKGHGRVGQRSTGRRISRRSDTSANGISILKKDTSFDVAYRVAINSRILLNILGGLMGMDFPEDRNVWLRPFKYLVAYEMEIRQALQKPKQLWIKPTQRQICQIMLTPSKSSMQLMYHLSRPLKEVERKVQILRTVHHL